MRRCIGIDGSRATVGQPTGTERYAIELLSALAKLDQADEFRVYFNQPTPPTALDYPGRAVCIPGARFWTVRSLAREMRRDPPDLLFVPSHVIPPFHPKAVVTIHDLGYLIEPECHEPRHRKQLEWTTRWNCHAATGIIAVSESTRRDLIDLLRVPGDRVEVIPHGVSPAFARASPDAIEKLRAGYHLPGRFILAVGTIHPRKNLVRLIQAFEFLANDDPDLALVLVGRPGWRADEILDRVKRSPFFNRILHLGFVQDAELPALYSAATVTAFVSLYEGFGLPALESMSCGTPVVAANRSSLPDVCGGAAILVDPFDSVQIASGLARALDDRAWRRAAIRRGRDLSSSFTWQNCAQRTLAFLRAFRDNSI